MSNFADKYSDLIRENQPISYLGLEFWPLAVRDYGLYLMAKPAFELLQSSLSPKLARMSWAACLKALDDKSEGEGWLRSVLCVIARALRLQPQLIPDGGYMAYPIFPIYAPQGGELTAIQISDFAGSPATVISVQQMDDIRQLIAAQNGYDIPDERWNPELVQAAQENKSRGNSGIVFDLEALVHSVAVNCGVSAKVVWDWSIREFKLTQDAIDRRLNYCIFTLTEMVGISKFKDGNPCPTWKFDRKSGLPTGFQNLAELDSRAKGLLAETN